MSVNVLQYVISALSTNTTGIADLAKLQIAKLLLQGLRASSSNIGSAMFEPLEQAFYRLLKSFPRQSLELNCDGAGVCYASVMNVENDLISDLVTFWFEATLPRNAKETSSSSGATAVMILLKKSKMMLPKSKCVCSQSKPLESRIVVPSIQPREMGDVPRIDWRNGMRDVLMCNSQMLNDKIMHEVGNICWDLEQRCGSIEAPLRAAEEERTKYYLELQQMTGQNHELKTQLQQASTTIAGLQEEMSRLAGHADSATFRVDELSANLFHARKELEELRLTSQETLSSERESSRTKELDIIASLTEKDERLDGLQEEVKCQAETNEELKAKLASASKDKDSSLEEVAGMKDEISTLQSDLEQSRVSMAQKDARIEQLTAEKHSAEESTAELESMVRSPLWAIIPGKNMLKVIAAARGEIRSRDSSECSSRDY